MKILLKTICNDAFHTKESGTLNIIGVFENINVTKFPAVHHKVSFVFIIEGDPSKELTYNYHMDITDSSDKKVFDGSNLPKQARLGVNGRGHLILNIFGIKFLHEGVYSANFFIGDIKDSIEFNVLGTKTA